MAGKAAHLMMVGARDAGYVQGYDFYASPPEAIESLCDVEKFEGPIWECACGDGAISKVLEGRGYQVISTDLVDRGYGKGGVDFLQHRFKPIANIVTNPPYNLANDFALKAVASTTGKVAFLMRLVWLEGKARRKIFETTPLARVHVFSKRIPRMHRGDYDGPKTTSTIAFAWFVWEHGYVGPPTINWV